MSRIGRLPINVPAGVEVNLQGTRMTVTGARGTLARDLSPEMQIGIEGGLVTVARPTDQTRHRALHGLTRTLISNMVVGVSTGYTRELDLVGVGYRAAKQGDDLQLNLGYSHPIRFAAPEGITFEVPEPVRIQVIGNDKELVGRVASQLRKLRPPEPYKGKGVMYRGERIKRKAGKSGKAK
jgi:large subunit ribosomal protein L6